MHMEQVVDRQSCTLGVGAGGVEGGVGPEVVGEVTSQGPNHSHALEKVGELTHVVSLGPPEDPTKHFLEPELV